MKAFKTLPRLLAVFGLVLMLAMSGWGADECSIADANFKKDPLSSSIPFSKDDSVNSSSDSYYFKAPSAGDVTITISGSNVTAGRVKFTYGSSGSCPGTSGALTTTTKTLSASDLDFNIKVYRASGSNSQSYTITVYFTPTSSYTVSNPRDFTINFQQNMKGNIKIIGNSILCQNNGSGQCSASVDLDKTNNELSTLFYKLPSDSTNASILNSTSYTFALPAGVLKSDVVWAGLYWQAGIKGTPSSTQIDNAKKVLLKGPADIATSKGYQQIDAETFNNRFNWMVHSGVGDAAWYYQGTKDITDIVKTQGAGEYRIANIEATKGTAYTPGHFGGWAIVLVYQQNDGTFKNITVYDGFFAVSGNTAGTSLTRDLTGFLTPSTGTVNSTFLYFGSEGDRKASSPYNGDSLSLTQSSTSGTRYYLKSDGTTTATSGSYNPMNSSISSIAGESRVPNYDNVIGVDIDTYNVGTSAGGSGIIVNNQNGTTIKLSTANDVFNPGVFAFATDIYTPEITITKTPSSSPTDTLQPGDPIDYTATFKNVGKEAASDITILDDFTANLQKLQNGDDTDPVVYLSDLMDRNATKIKQSIRLSRVNSTTTWDCLSGATGSPTCNGATNADCGVDFDAALGAEAGATKIWCKLPTVAVNDTYTMKFSINLSTAPDTRDQNIKVSNQMFASYKNALIGGTPIVSGSNLADAGNYTGESFAKVDAAETTIGTPPWKIYTKITNQPVTLSVAHFDPDSSSVSNIKPYTQGLVGWRIVPSANCPSGDGNITAWQDVNLSSGANTISFTPNFVNKDVKIQFAPKNNDYPSAKRNCSSDTFAVRPNKFAVSMVGGESPNLLKSGESYNFNIAAKDIANATVTGYNQTNANVSIATAKKYAPDGTESLSMSGTTSNMSGNNYTFTNGVTGNMSFAFSDVGKIKIDINDTNWAAIDASDGTSEDVRTIKGEGNFTFIPFQFAIGNVTLRGADGGSNGSFVYLSNDLNMSARVDTTITAQNKQGATTQNFSSASWENNISITPSAAYTAPNGTVINGLENSFSANKFGFTNGAANVVFNDANSSKVVRFNFPRDNNVTARNPFSFTNANGDLNITVASVYSDAGFADVTIENNATNKDANITSLNFNYARAHTPRQRATAAAHTANIYYEAYCFGTDSTGVTCNKALLPNGATSRHTDDIRWYQNTTHSAGRDGNVTALTQSGAALVTNGAITNGANNTTTTALTYAGTNGYPYKTTMEMTTLSSWLVYHPTSATILTNPFQIEYDRDNANWSGAAAAGQKTKNVGGVKTNRRKMW